MSSKNPRSIQPAGDKSGGGFFGNVTNRVKLIWRLINDERVSPLLKLLPVSTIVYLFVPTDLLPLLPFDDAAVLWLGSNLFVELCPPEVVQEHLDALANSKPVVWKGDQPTADPNTVDTTFRDVNSNDPGI